MAKVGEIFVALGVKDNLTKDIKKAENAVEDFGKEAKRSGSAAQSASQGMQQAASAAGGLRRPASGATMALMNMNRVVQDAPFGFMAVSNNIDPLIASFQQLKTQTGGTGSAFKAMIGALKGPAGIITLVSLATTAVLAFGDKIAAAFAGAKSGAEEAAAAVKAFREEVDRIGKTVTIGEGENKLELTFSQAKQVLQELNAQLLQSNRAALDLAEGSAKYNEEVQKGIELTKAITGLEKQLTPIVRGQIDLEKILNSETARRLFHEKQVTEEIQSQHRAKLMAARIAHFDLLAAGRPERATGAGTMDERSTVQRMADELGLAEVKLRDVEMQAGDTQKSVVEAGSLGRMAFDTLSQATGGVIADMILMDDKIDNLKSGFQSLFRIAVGTLVSLGQRWLETAIFGPAAPFIGGGAGYTDIGFMGRSAPSPGPIRGMQTVRVVGEFRQRGEDMVAAIDTYESLKAS